MRFIRLSKFSPTQLVWNQCHRGALSTDESNPKMGNINVPMMKEESENFQYLLDSGKEEMMTIGSIYRVE